MNNYDLMSDELLENDGLYYDLPVKIGNILNSVISNRKFKMNEEYPCKLEASVGKEFAICVYIGNKLTNGKLVSQFRVTKLSHSLLH
jgi:hypothetical protein